MSNDILCSLLGVRIGLILAYRARCKRVFTTTKPINPKYWQIGLTQSVDKMVSGIIYWSGGAEEFEVSTSLDTTPATLTVFCLDPRGESVVGSRRRGFEVMRIEIEHPNRLLISTLNCRGEKETRHFETIISFKTNIKSLLEEIMSRHYSTLEALNQYRIW